MTVRWGTPAIVSVLAASWRRSWNRRFVSPRSSQSREKDRVSTARSQQREHPGTVVERPGERLERLAEGIGHRHRAGVAVLRMPECDGASFHVHIGPRKRCQLAAPGARLERREDVEPEGRVRARGDVPRTGHP